MGGLFSRPGINIVPTEIKPQRTIYDLIPTMNMIAVMSEIDNRKRELMYDRPLFINKNKAGDDYEAQLARAKSFEASPEYKLRPTVHFFIDTTNMDYNSRVVNYTRLRAQLQNRIDKILSRIHVTELEQYHNDDKGHAFRRMIDNAKKLLNESKDMSTTSLDKTEDKINELFALLDAIDESISTSMDKPNQYTGWGEYRNMNNRRLLIIAIVIVILIVIFVYLCANHLITPVSHYYGVQRGASGRIVIYR